MAKAKQDSAEAQDDAHRKTGFGKKLVGLFVESEESKHTDPEVPAAPAPAEQVAAIAAEVAGRAAPRAPQAPPREGPPAPERPVPPPSYKPPDYEGIFKTLGMSDDDRDRLAKTEGLLRNLPSETPPAVKRQIVEGTLRAFAIAPEKITGAANRAIGALDTWLNVGEQELRTRIEATEKRLQELRAEEQRLSAALSERQAVQFTLIYDVRNRQAELKRVIEFFGETPTPPKAG